MAVAAGLCTIGLVSGCTPQEEAGPGSAAVDSAVASALKEEGEVQFATLGDLEQDAGQSNGRGGERAGRQSEGSPG